MNVLQESERMKARVDLFKRNSFTSEMNNVGRLALNQVFMEIAHIDPKDLHIRVFFMRRKNHDKYEVTPCLFGSSQRINLENFAVQSFKFRFFVFYL